MKKSGIGLAIYIGIAFTLWSCSITSTTNSTRTQTIITNQIRQLPQLAEYYIASSNKITGTAETYGDVLFGPTIDMVLKQAIYNALKNNSADILIHGMYKATVTDVHKTRHISVEVSGFPGKYTTIQPITGEDAKIFALLDTMRQFFNPLPTHDDSVEWEKELSFDNMLEAAAPEKAKEPLSPVKSIAKNSETTNKKLPEKEKTVTTSEQKPISPARSEITEPEPVKTEPVKESVKELVKESVKEATPEVSSETKRLDEDEITADGYVYHRVREGETMSSITAKYGLTESEIKRWNYLPDGIKAGTHLVVGTPLGKKSEEKKTIAQPPVVNGPDKYTYHVVLPNETLYHIGQVYHVTVRQIVEWNNIGNGTIAVGQKLIVGK